MREWQKPTIEETESGMEVTSYLPAELDRANPLSLISEILQTAIRLKPGSPFRFSAPARTMPRRLWQMFRSGFLNLVSS